MRDLASFRLAAAPAFGQPPEQAPAFGHTPAFRQAPGCRQRLTVVSFMHQHLLHSVITVSAAMTKHRPNSCLPPRGNCADYCQHTLWGAVVLMLI